MRCLKIFGLAFGTAVAVMAITGVAAAPATVLCKTTVSPCPAGWDWAFGFELHIDLTGSARFENPEGMTEVTCSESRLDGRTSNTGSATETVRMNIEGQTIGSCEPKLILIRRGSIEFHSVAGGSGVITGKESEWTVNIHLGEVSTISCIYGFGSGTSLGVFNEPTSVSTDATAEINSEVKKVSGSFLCPASQRLTANYRVTTPTPLYVSSS